MVWSSTYIYIPSVKGTKQTGKLKRNIRVNTYFCKKRHGNSCDEDMENC